MRNRRSKTQWLRSWPTSDLVNLQSDLKSDPTLGQVLQPATGWQWLAACSAVLQLRTASETTEQLF